MNEATVVVTVKDSVSTIRECIESILANKFPKDVIVIDAFSTDGTYEALREFGRKIKLFQVEGPAPVAFNYGIRKANTPVVALTDADCTVEKDWLGKLVEPIKGKYVAAAGSCWTPKDEKGLARAIGEAFDERYDIEDKEVTRAPSMNLAFRTSIGRKVGFDESMPIAFETDFCFRLLKHGKMAYVKDAKVYHHHRASWRKFFGQQKDYGKYGALVYLRHPGRTSGDHISKRRFFAQVGLLYASAALSLGSFFVPRLAPVALAGVGGIMALFAYEVIRTRPRDPLIFIGMLGVRLIAWGIGGLEGLAARING
jgi:glycosyltransferase involved in cell wall biosynthesis